MALAPSDFGAAVQGLDPTQKLLTEMLVEWADRRAAWRQALPATGRVPRLGPALRLTVLGTAGTGKTHTAKIAISEVRRRFRSYNSVVTMAFAGVAAGNLGSGATTIAFSTRTMRLRPKISLGIDWMSLSTSSRPWNWW